jgi:hypothetical protein
VEQGADAADIGVRFNDVADASPHGREDKLRIGGCNKQDRYFRPLDFKVPCKA